MHNSQISRPVFEMVLVFRENVLSAVTQTALRDFSPARQVNYIKKLGLSHDALNLRLAALDVCDDRT